MSIGKKLLRKKGDSPSVHGLPFKTKGVLEIYVLYKH